MATIGYNFMDNYQTIMEHANEIVFKNEKSEYDTVGLNFGDILILTIGPLPKE